MRLNTMPRTEKTNSRKLRKKKEQLRKTSKCAENNKMALNEIVKEDENIDLILSVTNSGSSPAIVHNIVADDFNNNIQDVGLESEADLNFVDSCLQESINNFSSEAIEQSSDNSPHQNNCDIEFSNTTDCSKEFFNPVENTPDFFVSSSFVADPTLSFTNPTSSSLAVKDEPYEGFSYPWQNSHPNHCTDTIATVDISTDFPVYTVMGGTDVPVDEHAVIPSNDSVPHFYDLGANYYDGGYTPSLWDESNCDSAAQWNYPPLWEDCSYERFDGTGCLPPSATLKDGDPNHIYGPAEISDVSYCDISGLSVSHPFYPMRESGGREPDGMGDGSPYYHQQGGGSDVHSPSDSSNPRVKQERRCGVCGDRALGYNFNAVTCESCKAFFRRNALKTKALKCPFQNNCKVDTVTRRFCQKCRLQKCFDIGMKKEWIMTEEEKKKKKQKIEANKIRKHGDCSTKLSFDSFQHDSNHSIASNFEANSPEGLFTPTSSCSANDTSVSPYDPISPAKEESLVVPEYDDQALQESYMKTPQFSSGFPFSPESSTSKPQAVVIGMVRNSSDLENEGPSSKVRKINHQKDVHNMDHFSEPPCADRIQTPNSTVHKRASGLEPLFDAPYTTPAKEVSPDFSQNNIFPDSDSFQPRHSKVFPFDSVSSPISLFQANTSNSAGLQAGLLVKLNSSYANTEASSSNVNQEPRINVEPRIDHFNCATSSNNKTSFPTSELKQLVYNEEFTKNNIFSDNKLNDHIAKDTSSCQASTSFQSSTSCQASTSFQSHCRPGIGNDAARSRIENLSMGDFDRTIKSVKTENDITSGTSPNSNVDNPPNTSRHDDWSDFNVLDALHEINPNSVNTSHQKSNNMVDDIVNSAVQAEYSSFSLLTTYSCTVSEKGNHPKNSLSAPEKFKLDELKKANEAMNAPLSEDRDYKEDPHNTALVNVINMTEVAIRRLIQMSKQLSAFSVLCTEDQIALLKGSCTEMMILRSVTAYEPDKDSWKIPEDHDKYKSIKLKVLKGMQGNSYAYEEHKNFIFAFDPAWRNDQDIMLLMSAITLFTPTRANVKHPEAIKHEQCVYLFLLKRYLECKFGGCEGRTVYASLLERINDLRRLNENHLQLYLQVNPELVRPLLIEIFDLKNR